MVNSGDFQRSKPSPKLTTPATGVDSKRFTEAKDFKTKGQSLKRYVAPTVDGNTAVVDVPDVLFVLAADEYYFFDRFSGRLILIGNDPIAWAKAKVIPRLNEQAQPLTITPPASPTGIVPPTGAAQPFTPVDRIYTATNLHDLTPYPGCWDFTLSRKGSGFFANDEVITPIPSPISGKVTWAKRRGGYGNAVEVTGSDGVLWFMGHLHSIAVSEGQQVVRGQTLGLQGFSGNIRPPNEDGTHIHLEIWRNNAILPYSATAPLVREYFRFVSGGKAPTLNGPSP